MKIIITGSDGQLGKTLSKIKNLYFENCNEIFFFNKCDFDLEKKEECIKIIKEIKPKWFINCAAYTNVDKAEIETEKSLYINGYAIKYIAETLREINCNLIQVSTDYVFNGQGNSPYKIYDVRKPINKYGEGKSIGEKFTEDILFPDSRSKIVRTSWLMSALGNNFAKTMLKLHKSKSEFRVVTDQVGCFTSTNTLSEFLWEIILKEEQGFNLPNIMHCTNSGICSWFDIAIAVGEFAEKNSIIKKSAKIIPIEAKEFPSAANRPKYSVLDSLGSNDFLKKESEYWRFSLEKIIQDLKTNK